MMAQWWSGIVQQAPYPQQALQVWPQTQVPARPGWRLFPNLGKIRNHTLDPAMPSTVCRWDDDPSVGPSISAPDKFLQISDYLVPTH